MRLSTMTNYRLPLARQLRRQPRHAITLIEVLMSTMVISLGVMGLLALIPLGNHLANRGLEADRVSSLGQRIYREARTRGVLNPDNWIDRVQGGAVGSGDGVKSFLAPGEVLPARQSYMIDPTYIINNDSGRNLFPTQDDLTGSSINTNRMRRLTLRRISGAGPMSEAQAHLAFSSSDQLAFERPKATDDPLTNSPVQQFYVDGATALKRQIQRPFSWMIMLTPEPVNGLMLYGPASDPQRFYPPFSATDDTALVNNKEYSTDQYNMSTIIMRNRPVPADFTFPDNEDIVDRDEQVFEVTDFSFGEVTLRMPTTTFDADESEDIMDLARGKWICLTARFRSGTPITARHSVYKWYRVLSVDEVNTNNNTLNVSIQGPDWNYLDSSGNIDPPTQAIYVRSVVGVYERKVRLESLSKWTP